MARERARIGTDHAAAGAWLLSSWGLPERICAAIERSHRSEFRQSRSEADKFDSCIRVAGLLADCILRQEETRIAREVAAMVERGLGIGRPRFAVVLEGIHALHKEVQAVFDAGASGAAISEEMLLRARANLHGNGSSTEPDGAELPATAISRILELDKPAQLDPVTGLLNDDTLMRLLEREFQYASKHAWPLSVLIIGACRLDSSSKNAAQTIDQRELVAIAHYLFASTRDTDALARHKVDQFALILPGTDAAAAERVAHRLSSRSDRIVAVDGRSVPVGLLIGIASIDGDRFPSSAGELLAAAAARLG
jgi:diguanylate cyclase (GGDEF)-like protein